MQNESHRTFDIISNSTPVHETYTTPVAGTLEENKMLLTKYYKLQILETITLK